MQLIFCQYKRGLTKLITECVCACVRACVCVHMHMCVCVCACMHTCMHARVCACMRACVHVCDLHLGSQHGKHKQAGEMFFKFLASLALHASF